MKTITSKVKNGTNNAQAALADLNQQIQALHQQRIGLPKVVLLRVSLLSCESFYALTSRELSAVPQFAFGQFRVIHQQHRQDKSVPH
jgi:hypothetical protein